MTDRTACKSLYSIFLHEPRSEFRLVCGMAVVHPEDISDRTHMLLRVAVTCQTPGHCEGWRLPDQRHLVHSSVAFGAANTLMEMNAVIEVDILRKLINTCPLDRKSRLVTPAHRFQVWRHRPHFGVTIQTNRGGRDIRERAIFHADMTIPAVYPEAAHVVFMTE